MTTPIDLSVDEITTSLNTLVIKKSRFSCDEENCEKSYYYFNMLKQHMLLDHNIQIDPSIKGFKCDWPECTFSCEFERSLKPHKRNVHDVKDFVCDICNKIFPTSRNLTRHLQGVHSTGTANIHKCVEVGCNYETHLFQNLKTHIMFVHTIDTYNFSCDITNCKSKFKTQACIIRHKLLMHNSNHIRIKCDIINCNVTFKQKCNMEKHKITVHGINLIMFYCDIDNCTSGSKTQYDLNNHKKTVHDIGLNNCDICLDNHNTSIKYVDVQQNELQICRTCFKVVTGKGSQKEIIMSEYLDKLEEISSYLLGSNNTFASMGGCSLKRPDKIYMIKDLIIWIECDEYQHTRYSYSYTCDEKRISDAYDEFSGKQLVVIRWNPDKYIPENGTPIPVSNRLLRLKSLILDILKNPPKDIIYIYYMYYDVDNELLPENFNYEIIQN